MRASSCSTIRGRPDIAHTSDARPMARLERPDAEKREAPSPSRVTAPPVPSSVPSRSTYRQRTPALWRASAHDERALAQQPAVAVLAAVPVPAQSSHRYVPDTSR